MPRTYIHFSFNVVIYFIVSLVFSIDFLMVNCVYLLFSDLIDLDHLFSRPIFHPRRNPFKTHYFHKHWKFILCFGLGCLFFSQTLFFGLGLISHIMLDYVYTKYWLKL